MVDPTSSDGDEFNQSPLEFIRNPTTSLPKYAQTGRHKSCVEKKDKRKRGKWSDQKHYAETELRAKAQKTLDDFFEPANGANAVHPINPHDPLEYINANTSPLRSEEDDYFGVKIKPFEFTL